MRQILLDTETTGLDPNPGKKGGGHRLIEIAALEMNNRNLTDQQFHCYLRPEREIDENAYRVHGLTQEFLADKPVFLEVVDEFIDFLRGADSLVIHNAPFDLGFINAELSRAGLEPIEELGIEVIDTLKIARERFPGKRNNLDALCERYEIDKSGRQLHGALIDTELLSKVYLAMTRGQDSLIGEQDIIIPDALAGTQDASGAKYPPQIVLPATEEEKLLHQSLLEQVDKESDGQCLWLKNAQKG